MPGDSYDFSEPGLCGAVERWRSRAARREGAVCHAGARRDTPERQQLFRERMRRAELLGAHAGSPGRERHLGPTNDLHSIEFLERGLQAARAVVRVSVFGGARNGTAVLVAPGVALTNHHVVPDRRTALRTTIVTFDEERRIRPHRDRHDLELDPGRFFFTDPALDVTFVGVRDPDAPVRTSRALAECGWLPLFDELGKILLGHPVNLIQHPGGRQKHVVTQNSVLVDVEDGAHATDHCWYTGDTEPGSSGSPVFNNRWEVVALHHRAVPRTDAQGAWLDTAGRVLTPDDLAAGRGSIDWIANEGARCSRIVGALRGARLTEPAAARLRSRMLGLWTDARGSHAAFRTGWRAGPAH